MINIDCPDQVNFPKLENEYWMKSSKIVKKSGLFAQETHSTLLMAMTLKPLILDCKKHNFAFHCSLYCDLFSEISRLWRG